MAILKKFKSPREFLEYNEELFNGQYFEHIHLHHIFLELRNGQAKLIDAFNIIDEDDSNVIVVRVRQEFFIYSNKWNESTLEVIENELNQIDTEALLFRGQKEIVLNVMGRMKFNFVIINDRIIYDCNFIEPLPKKAQGKFGVANISDLPTVQKMSVDYYVEEFEGKGQQSHESVRESAYQGIKSSSVFKWSNNGRIVSMARLLGDNPRYAMIGGLFTRVIERNKGYAYFLISELTRHLLNNGAEKCGLLTEATKIPTNKIFEKVGYKKVYDWINILKK